LLLLVAPIVAIAALFSLRIKRRATRDRRHGELERSKASASKSSARGLRAEIPRPS
jgi:hypothetical protein